MQLLNIETTPVSIEAKSAIAPETPSEATGKLTAKWDVVDSKLTCKWLLEQALRQH